MHTFQWVGFLTSSKWGAKMARGQRLLTPSGVLEINTTFRRDYKNMMHNDAAQ